jgi:multidrug efflux pump
MHGDAILATLRKRFAAEIPGAQVNVFTPPAVSGLGRAGGFKMMVEDRGDNGLAMLQAQTDNLIARAKEQPDIETPFTVFNANSPQLFIDVDRSACMSQGIALGDVFGTLQGYLGSRYVNDFNRFGRTWQVIVQADAQFRDQIEDVRKLRVRNSSGGMVPLGAVATVRETSAPLVVTRYNMYPAAAIQGSVAPGVSTGEGIDLMEALARRELPPSMAAEWTEITYIERMSTNTGMVVFGFSVIFVFLVLAALYESWSLPLAVILVVPMCVLSSIAGVWWMKMDINVFTQIGFVVLIGLASKNAILIVEFAKLRRDEGVDRREATLQACRLRLRPIMMTSFAFILGVVPLLAAHGAGAEMRRVLGTAVFSGMLGVTFFGIFLTPVFFFVIDLVAHRRRRLAGSSTSRSRPVDRPAKQSTEPVNVE